MFTGFGRSDFSAYEERKWKSNVFNRERMEVKQKLVALGRVVEGALTDADGAPLQAETSVEHPAHFNHKQVEAQHLYFSRNEGARKALDAIIVRERSMGSIFDDPSPQRNHLFLVVTVGQHGVDIGLRLHPDAKVDRENLERKLADHFEIEKAMHLFGTLGDDYRVGVGTPDRTASSLDEAALGELITRFGSPPMTPGPVPLLTIARSFSEAEVAAAGDGFAATAGQELGRLLPLYHFIAWSRNNDFVSMREQLQKEQQTRRQRGLAKHDTVRIVKGIMSGKSGVVQEIDQKGGLRLLVGKMMIKVDAEDVVKS